jgi:hypothetical protein
MKPHCWQPPWPSRELFSADFDNKPEDGRKQSDRDHEEGLEMSRPSYSSQLTIHATQYRLHGQAVRNTKTSDNRHPRPSATCDPASSGPDVCRRSKLLASLFSFAASVHYSCTTTSIVRPASSAHPPREDVAFLATTNVGRLQGGRGILLSRFAPFRPVCFFRSTRPRVVTRRSRQPRVTFHVQRPAASLLQLLPLPTRGWEGGAEEEHEWKRGICQAVSHSGRPLLV